MLAPPPFKLEHFPRVVAHFRRSGKEKCHAAVAIGVYIPRVEPDGLVVVGNGLVVILLGAPGFATTVVGACIPRIEPDGFVVVSNGLVVILLGAPGIATTVVGAFIPGIEPDGFVVVSNGLVVILLVAPDNATGVISECMPGIEPDGFVAVSNGFVVILLVAPGSAAALVGDARGARIEPDGLVIVSDGGVKLFSLQPDVGSPDIFSPIARLCADLARDVVDGLVEEDDVSGRCPALGAGALGHEEEPGAIGLLNHVGPEDVLVFSPGQLLAEAFVVNDLVAYLEDSAGLRDHPLAHM